jgi:deoxycytidine triphosphate deaminase
MTLLHNRALIEALEEQDFDKRLVVTPLLDMGQVGEASIDLRLGSDFLLLRRTLRPGVDVAEPNLEAQIDELYDPIAIPLGKGLWLHPHQFVLGVDFRVRASPADARRVHPRTIVMGTSWAVDRDRRRSSTWLRRLTDA